MKSNLIYGLVIDNTFYSNRMKCSIKQPNGIYSMDMSKDNFRASIYSADIDDAIKFFKKSSNIQVIKGISFHDGIIPENPIVFKQIPIKVIDAIYDDFEEIEVAILYNLCYFLRIISTEKSFAIMEAKQALDENKSIQSVKGISPEIRISFVLKNIEKEILRKEEEQKIIKEKQKIANEKLEQEMKNPTSYISYVMNESGATVRRVKKVNRGYEVIWSVDNHTINTLLSNDFRVIEAGFCTSGYDSTQSVSSVAKLLHNYVEDGSYIHRTRE